METLIKRQLAGTSETVSGDPYILYFYVPDNMKISFSRAENDGNREIPVEAERDGNLFRMSFPGQSEKVKWTLNFSSGVQ